MTYEEPSRATTELRTVNTILEYIFKSWLNQFFYSHVLFTAVASSLV